MPASSEHLSAARRRRLRVTVSCTYCRKKKTKCDGAKPCSNCKQQDQPCTYVPSRDSENKEIQANQRYLEERVQKLERLLRNVLESQASSSGSTNSDPTPISTTQINPEPSSSTDQDGQDEDITYIDRLLEGVELDDDQTGWTYQGNNSNISFLRCMRQQIGDFVSEDGGKGMSSTDSPLHHGLRAAVNQKWHPEVTLPPRDVAESLVSVALEEGCSLFAFINRQTFDRWFVRLYEISPRLYGPQELSFLPKLCAVFALGFVCQAHPVRSMERARAVGNGATYFVAARQRLDLANCRTTDSIQTVVLLAMFCLQTGQLNMCYTYCSIAQASALQMGLHRNLKINLDFKEMEARRRVFWAIRKLEVLVGSMIGFPRMLSEKDIDQILPDVSDPNSTDEHNNNMTGEVRIADLVNAQTRLFQILARVMRLIPHAGPARTSLTFQISGRDFSKIERQLQEWADALPRQLRPGVGTVPDRIEKLRFVLRLTYSYVRYSLYRPFLPYAAPVHAPSTDKRCISCGCKGIEVSTDMIRIAQGMFEKGLLQGEEWFVLNALFFSTMTLSFIVIEYKTYPNVENFRSDATVGYEMLKSLTGKSLWASLFSKNLMPVFRHMAEMDKNTQSSGAFTTSVNQPPHSQPSGQPLQRSPQQPLHEAQSLPLNPGNLNTESAPAIPNQYPIELLDYPIDEAPLASSSSSGPELQDGPGSSININAFNLQCDDSIPGSVNQSHSPGSASMGHSAPESVFGSYEFLTADAGGLDWNALMGNDWVVDAGLVEGMDVADAERSTETFEF